MSLSPGREPYELYRGNIHEWVAGLKRLRQMQSIDVLNILSTYQTRLMKQIQPTFYNLQYNDVLLLKLQKIIVLTLKNKLRGIWIEKDLLKSSPETH